MPPQGPRDVAVEREPARTLEHLGLLGWIFRVRTGVSRSSYVLLIGLPIISAWCVFRLAWHVVPGRFRDAFVGATTTTTTLSPALSAQPWIRSPSLEPVAIMFLGTALSCVVGGALGLVVWAADRVLGEVFGHAEADDRSPRSARRPAVANRQPLLESESGEHGSELPFPELCMHEQFLQLAAARGGHVAAHGGGLRATYGELRGAVLAAAAVLREGGVAEGALVALFLEGGVGVVVAILAVWCNGGAWTPIDREAPRSRIAALVEDGRPSAIICDDDGPFGQVSATVFHFDASDLRIRLSPACARVAPPPPPNARAVALQSVAQVVYTSGSTGTPKGVIYSHRRLAFACHFFAASCGIADGTRVLQKTPYIWAVFRHEVFPALAHGGEVVFAGPGQRKDPRVLAELIRDHGIEVVVATPSVLELILDAGALPSLKTAVCMGEGLPKSLAGRILERSGGLRLLNFYGSTETENTCFEVPRPGTVRWQLLRQRYIPAGRPQPCVSVHILVPEGADVCPLGAEGEICFGGVLSDGYWGKPEMTAERFVHHPRLGRIYRTGDLGRWDAALGLQVLGRTDRQVKIRGIRIELEEVEASMRSAVWVLGGKEVVAVAAPTLGGPPEHLALVAFAAPASPSLSAAELRKECHGRMPPYMVPSVIQVVDALPRLPNQKIDLRAVAVMAEKAEETVQAVDSLGMLRLLSRAQVEEDTWIQNQQAFWMLVVMLGHFQLNDGAATADGVDCGNLAWRGQMLLGHGKDMVAFILMVGFTDSRDPIRYGPRDVVLLILALLMSGPLSYILSPGYGMLQNVFKPPAGIPYIGHGWFLYSFVFARVALNALHRLGVPPAAQVFFSFLLSCLFPDDILELVPGAELSWLWEKDAAFRYKGFRWSFLFLTACYLLAFHCGAHAVHFARRHAPTSRWVVAMLVGASWTGFLAMSVFNSPDRLLPWCYPHFQAIYDEASSSHFVLLHYMTHPGIWIYLSLWLSEVVLFVLPGVLVAIAMAYCPVHFKTMGTTSLGNYVLHPTYIGAPWTKWLQGPVLSRITSPSLPIPVNVSIVFLWNVSFCLLFAHTLSAWFHQALLGCFGLLRRVTSSVRSVRKASLAEV